MTTRITALTSIALLALGTSVFAQTTDGDATPPEAPAAEEQAPAPADLNMGEDANAPQIGQTYVRETEKDWEIQCVLVEEGQEEPCQMYQLLKDDQGTPVAEISLFRLPEGGQAVAGATIIVPLETSLQSQLRISVDGSQGKRYPYAFCNSIGCYARIGLTNEDVTSFKRGAKAKVSIVPFLAPDQTVNLDLSLSGFTASFEKTSVLASE